MAILENIRKRSLILILVIGLALFAFVINDVISNRGMAATTSTIGEINGKSVSRDEFLQKVENASRMYGGNVSNLQIVNQVWNQEVRGTLLNEQFEKLGIDIEKDQIINVVKSNPAFAQDPTFLNEAGVFDEGKFIEFLADLRANNPAGYAQWQMQETALINASKEQSYFNLIKAGVGSTVKDGENAYRLENDKVDIKYVKIPYTAVPDSTVTVSDKEIEAYVKAHEKQFKSEASRDIRYVYFSEEPSAEDEQSVKDRVSALLNSTVVYNDATKSNDTLAGFAAVSDVADFVARHSDIRLDTTYVTKSSLPAAYADTLYNLKDGEVFGPYKDGNYYKLSRMIDKKSNATVKASHILIAFDGAQAQPKESRTKEQAKALADELLASAKKNPDTFAVLALENSEDPGSATRGGTYDNIPEGQMVKPFNDFIFNNAVGTIGVVETDFGYHVIKIDDKYDGVKIATVAQEIEASEETINEAFNAATKFEMAVAEKDFADVAAESAYEVHPVKYLQQLDENVAGIGAQRSIVQWAFNEDTDLGDVRKFNVTGGYAIVQVTKKAKAGLTHVSEARFVVQPILIKEKKAAIIMENNKGKSMEELAAANNVNVTSASGLNMKNPSIAGAGREPKVVGTAFSLKEGATSEMIDGNNGVYMIQVTKLEIAPEMENYSTYANAQKTLNRNKVNVDVLNALKESAEIEDNRAIFY